MDDKIVKMLTIDSSTNKTGLAFFENGKYSKCKLIDLSDLKLMDDRFPLMCSTLLYILDKFNPEIIYIEETAVTKNASTQRFLTRLQGVIYGWCIIHQCEFNTVRPTVWRKSLNFKQGRNIKREKLKEQAIDYINEHLNLHLSKADDDIADSICIGLYALNLFDIPLSIVQAKGKIKKREEDVEILNFETAKKIMKKQMICNKNMRNKKYNF